ncbi:DUF2268 domain-containing protein [Bacillus massiliigorillae]|uniref:DUF2268 domain-containing protein n=1 Tax=Bacillus massiliigorillae TaxID=1243664 RepID=UPI0003AA8862|nr:DUF2268 domain-containing putative Zn-dependent protease [Bacillus massiliigorillae]
MGVENTREWLKEHSNSPLKLCSKLTPYFGDTTEEQVYEYLQGFGMYTSSSKVESDLETLVEKDVWSHIERLFNLYREKWNGADIPIFIIPHKRQSFFSNGHHKSGLAFPDKLFLFLSPKTSMDDREALFVHEYHHVCRLINQKKKIDTYTLADSSVLEGLAEYTVQTIKGEKYLAPWTKQYSIEFLDRFWKAHFEENLTVTRKDRKHDQIMFGKGKYPAMIGYCMGYYLVDMYVQTHSFSVKKSFRLSSDEIIKNYREIKKKKDKKE